MKILFAMRSPGYVRNYHAMVQRLLDRGHTIVLAFEQPEKYSEFLGTLRSENGLLAHDTAPRRRDRWKGVALKTRILGDYLRYLDRRFRTARHLRERMAAKLPPGFGFLRRLPFLPVPLARLVVRAFLWLEACIPSAENVESYLRSHRPDLLVVTPLVNVASAQTDLIKSARRLKIPSVLAVGSWDHLTTKGLIRIRPGTVLVWNAVQKAEAISFHAMRAKQIVITGAQIFDFWFERKPSCSRPQFCRRVGLREDMDFITFVGSTASLTAPEREVEFVRRWLSALRQDHRPEIQRLGVLVRPHPYNRAHWDPTRLSGFENVALWDHGALGLSGDPEEKAITADGSIEQNYFDTLYHSTAVVGANSSALIEAAIVNRPVLSVSAPEFSQAQFGTLHFRYLTAETGGFLRLAPDFTVHGDQLAAALHDPAPSRSDNERFVRKFIRPNGWQDRASDRMVEVLERLGTGGTAGSSAETGAREMVGA